MDYPPQPLPATLQVDIVILDIVDLDWTTNTVSSFIQLWAFWKDPRITISNYVSEEIKEAGLIFSFSEHKRCITFTFSFL